MQFQVPQFIEVEDKIFGPLTFKQFIFIAGGCGFSYMLWRLLPLLLSAPLIAVVIGLAAALAFFKFNGRPFIIALENGFYYSLRSKLYLWNNQKKTRRKAKVAAAAPTPASGLYIPKISDSKLHELAWSLDIKERIAAGINAQDEHDPDALARVKTPQEVLSHMQGRALAR